MVVGFTVFALFITLSASYAQAAEVNILTGVDMTLGSTGQHVVVLQGLLQELGYMSIPTGIPLGYYGVMTRDGLARYQAALNVTPAVGYFGPVTKVAMHQQFLSKGWLTGLGW